jgi:hypothetical protein
MGCSRWLWGSYYINESNNVSYYEIFFQREKLSHCYMTYVSWQLLLNPRTEGDSLITRR